MFLKNTRCSINKNKYRSDLNEPQVVSEYKIRAEDRINDGCRILYRADQHHTSHFIGNLKSNKGAD
jgi:hypothetical protein